MRASGNGLPPREILKEVRLLITDVDGVLTDGSVRLDGDGRETTSYHIHDWAGLVYWHRAGGISGFLSGRPQKQLAERAMKLGVQELHLDQLDKCKVLDQLLDRYGLVDQQVAYIGDDLLDLPVLQRVGFSVSVPNGRPEVRDAVHHVTAAAGGEGALREVVEILLVSKGLWAGIVQAGGLK